MDMLPPINLRDINLPISFDNISISLANITVVHADQMAPDTYDQLEADREEIALATRNCQSKDELEQALKEEYGERLGNSDSARELAAQMAHETTEEAVAQAEGEQG